MAITYEWDVTFLEYKNSGSLEKCVYQTRWTKKGTDENGNAGTFEGATPFPIADVSSDGYVPYADLTKETVLTWIKAVVEKADEEGNKLYEAHVNEQIALQINRQADPSTTVDGSTDAKFPWG